MQTLSNTPIGFYLYKRRDHKTKVPQVQELAEDKVRESLSKILKSQIKDDLIMVAPTSDQIKKSRRKKIQNFKSSQQIQDSDLDLRTLNNTSEHFETQVSDFQEDLERLRQLHCDSTLKLYRNNSQSKPVTKDTDDLIETFVTKSVQMFEK